MAGGKFTDNGVKIVMERTFESSPSYAEPTKFKAGVGTTAADITDTDLETPIPITGTELADNCETVGNWAESADGADSLNSTTYKEGSGALNLEKPGTTASSVIYYNNNNMTSLDFTSKDLWVWLYIKDATTYAKLVAAGTAVQMRYGNDYNVNYYYIDYTKAQLAVGWNLLTMNTTSGTEVGSVTLNACDSGAIEITFTATSDTLAAGDVVLDDWKLASSDDYIKSFQATYPQINETTKMVTIRTRLASTEANGYNIAEHGIFNEDGTPLMMSRDTFTALSKSNTDEFIFVEKITFDNTT
jgi:hypothetical protein